MKTRIIHTRFWIDEYISGLSHKEKLAFIYFFTNERVNICGIYECPDRYIKMDLNLTQKELDNIKQKFMQDNKFLFIDSWVKIINHDEYNSFTGEKNEKAKQKELSNIPEKIINYVYACDRVSIGYVCPIDTSNNHIINNHIINNHNNINNIRGENNSKVKYGEYVLLTETEYQKLIGDLGEKKAKIMIEKLNLYIGSKGKKYKSHYFTILNWVRMEEEKNVKSDTTAIYKKI